MAISHSTHSLFVSMRLLLYLAIIGMSLVSLDAASNSSITVPSKVKPFEWPKPQWENFLGAESRSGLQSFVSSISRQKGTLSPDNEDIISASATTIAIVAIASFTAVVAFNFILFVIIKCTRPPGKAFFALKVVNTTLLIFSFVLVVLGNMSFLDSFAGEDGALEQTRSLFGDAISFMEVQGDRIGNLNNEIAASGNNISTILTRVGRTDEDTRRITDSLDTFNDTYAGRVLDINGTSWVCLFCIGIETTVSRINQEIEQTASPLLTDISGQVTSVRRDFASVLDSITDGLETGQSLVVRASQAGANQESNVDKGIDAAKDVEDARYATLLALSVVAMVLVPISWLSLCIKHFKLVKWLLVWVASTLLVIVASAHLTLSVAVQDSCNYLDQQEDNIVYNRTVGDELNLAIASCLTNQSIATVFAFENELDFAEMIDLSTDFDVDAALNFPELDSFVDSINALTPLLTFGFDSNLLIDQPLSDFNTDPSLTNGAKFYDRSNISEALGSDTGTGSSSARVSLRDNISQNVYVEMEMLTFISDMQRDILVVRAGQQEFGQDVATVAEGVVGIEELFSPLQNLALNFLDGSRCGNLGQGYVNAKERVCSGNLASSALIYIALMSQAILMLFSMQFAAADAMRKKNNNEPATDRHGYDQSNLDGTWRTSAPLNSRTGSYQSNMSINVPMMMVPLSTVGEYPSLEAKSQNR